MSQDLLSAEQAAALLGVKRTTLYSYVSRGLLRRVQGEDGRTRRYVRTDVLQLKARADARVGQAAVAEAALHGGRSGMETTISHVSPEGLWLRGQPLQALVVGGSFESVAALLWEGEAGGGSAASGWPAVSVPGEGSPVWSARRRLDRMMVAVVLDAAGDLARFGASAPADRLRAQRLCRLLAIAAAPSAEVAARAAVAERVAGVLAVSLGATDGPVAEPGLERALICCAEHGLSTTTFAARVTASTGADLSACLLSGLAALSGPQHAGMCDRISMWMRLLAMETLPPEVVVAQQLARGEVLPGFHHRLYPAGDPRTAPLLAVARAIPGARAAEAMALADAVVLAAQQRGYPPPRLDFALVVLCMALGLPADAAAAVFAVGRVAGWAAHVLEQRAQESASRPGLLPLT